MGFVTNKLFAVAIIIRVFTQLISHLHQQRTIFQQINGGEGDLEDFCAIIRETFLTWLLSVKERSEVTLLPPP